MAVWMVNLRPQSSVAAWLSSDTIFGAIFWALKHVHGEAELQKWLQCCRSDLPQVAFSSAFPFITPDPLIRFLPKPITLNPTAEVVAKWQSDRCQLLKAMETAKEVSKASFISESLFAQAAKGELTAEKLLEQVMSGQIALKSSCLLSAEEAKATPTRFWSTVDTQHSAVDRVLTSAAEGLLYFDTEHFFAPKVGLYFLVHCPDDFPLEAILRFLSHSGVGGNRTVGKGHFDWHAEPAEQWLANLEAQNGDAIVLLSRCTPKPEEFDWQKSLYRLTSKRPKFESAFGQPVRVYKGIIRQLLEGSVLCPKQVKPAYGQLLKVGDAQGWDGKSHPVFHNGIGFPLRVVMPNEMV
ncbi:MAG: hypothetical protein HZLCBSQH_000325 [Candidatus Fervidibacterota bacterium]